MKTFWALMGVICLWASGFYAAMNELVYSIGSFIFFILYVYLCTQEED